MDLTPATELDAVNVILMDMGEAPINSLEGDLPLDASKARLVLHEISRAVQERGWFWNTETNTYPRDSEGKIPLPTNALAVSDDNRSQSRQTQLSVRSGKLYRTERNNNGSVFDSAQVLEVTFFLPFEDLPSVARRYITIRAARVHQARELGDEILLQNASTEETIAYSQLRSDSNRNAKRSLKQTLSMSLITDRYNQRTGAFT
ncbi:hypothetical protein [Shimia sp.]|uniref:hypothetical protein n=1 Tax=Shimia sp. TaxID=1954381 RepID=UPI003BABD06E